MYNVPKSLLGHVKYFLYVWNHVQADFLTKLYIKVSLLSFPEVHLPMPKSFYQEYLTSKCFEKLKMKLLFMDSQLKLSQLSFMKIGLHIILHAWRFVCIAF